MERVFDARHPGGLHHFKQLEFPRISRLVIQEAILRVSTTLTLSDQSDLYPHRRCAHRGLFGDEVDLSSDVAHRASLPLKAAPVEASIRLINACSDFIRSRL
jgi:hypothetical protein